MSGLLTFFAGDGVTIATLSCWLPLLVALVLLLPDVLMVWSERGLRLGLFYFYGKLLTLAPLYASR